MGWRLTELGRTAGARRQRRTRAWRLPRSDPLIVELEGELQSYRREIER